MAHSVTERRDWRKISKLSAIALVAVGLAFIVGLYAVAPQLQRGADGYLPATLATMPAGMITVVNPDDTSAALLVRIADTADARSWGLRQVGPTALATTVVLYDQRREVTTRTTYRMEGLRAALEMAVIQVDGTVLSVQRVPQDAISVPIADRHRWVLVAREGVLSGMGIGPGSQLLPDEIKRLN